MPINLHYVTSLPPSLALSFFIGGNLKKKKKKKKKRKEKERKKPRPGFLDSVLETRS